MRRPLIITLLALTALAAAVTGALAAPGSQRPRSLRVGSVTLHPCPDGYAGECGHILRPLDPGLAGTPMIPIRVERVPARDGNPHAPTIVAVEGGPGYPSTGTFAEYLGTFHRALATHNLVMVDNRGTGDSALIRCRALQRFPKRSPAYGPAFDRLVGRCGNHLDHEYRTRGGQPIHAADLFSTEYAVTDLHVMLDRLGAGRVTLYGDSYGSWFTQAFMARYPDQLRDVVLDSTYAVHDLDPYYRTAAEVSRQVMDRVCARDVGCRRDARDQGTPVSRLGALVARLRRHPIRGSVRWTDGRRTITVTPTTLVNIVQDGGSDPWPWRELDASVRAALHGDDVPLLRLAVEDDDNGSDADPTYFSDGDYMAVSCTDYPQLFPMSATPAERRVAYGHAIARAPHAFAPFTFPEFVTMSAYSEAWDACLDWPAPDPAHAAPVLAPVGAHRLPARVPLLVVGGDLDDLTPLRAVQGFAPKIARDVRVVDLHNTVHVTSEGDTYLSEGARCARSIIDRFVDRPDRLQQMDIGCAAAIPHLHTPGAYPRTLAAATPATVVGGPPLSPRVRRAVTVAAGALGDATILAQVTSGADGPGLRGGTWTSHGDAVDLHAVRFVDDATVSGRGRYLSPNGATSARLTVAGPGVDVTVTLAWNQRSQLAAARVGASRLRLPAP